MANNEKKGSALVVISFLFSTIALILSVFTFLIVFQDSKYVNNAEDAKKEFFKVVDSKKADKKMDNLKSDIDDKVFDEKLLDKITRQIESAKDYFDENPSSELAKTKLNEAKEILNNSKDKISTEYSDKSQILSEKLDEVLKSINSKSKDVKIKMDNLIDYIELIKEKQAQKNESEKNK